MRTNEKSFASIPYSIREQSGRRSKKSRNTAVSNLYNLFSSLRETLPHVLGDISEAFWWPALPRAKNLVARLRHF